VLAPVDRRHLTWTALLLMFATIAALLPLNAGQFGPSVVAGWPNRLLVIAYSAWLMAVASARPA
jgi:hypothetical protein